MTCSSSRTSQMSPAIVAAVAGCCLDPDMPLGSALAMLGLLSQQTGCCPPGSFLGLLAALLDGPQTLREQVEHASSSARAGQLPQQLTDLWDRHQAVCAAGTCALVRIQDRGEPPRLSSMREATILQAWPCTSLPCRCAKLSMSVSCA